MKNKFLGVFVFLFALVSVVSCETEPLDSGLEDGSNQLRTSFSVRFDGKNYKTENAIALIENGKLIITAVKGNEIFVLKSNGVMVGTYTDSQLDFTYIESGDTNPYSNQNPVTGQNNSVLTITSINFQAERITGTFHFTGYRLTGNGENPTVEQIAFHEGTFENVPYGAGSGDEEPGEPSSGDYFPMAIGNTWNYDVSNEDENSQMKINSTETINGALYYKVTDLPIGVGADIPEGDFPGLDVRSHLRKNGANYIQRFYAFIPEMMGGLIPQMEIEAFEIIFLKDNLAVGESWTETKTIVTNVVMFGMSQTINANATFNSVIEEKGISMTVNGVTYTDVIKVKTTATVVSEDGTEVSEAQNWFAKDVGLIKSYSNDPEDGESEMNLIDYILN